MYSEKLVSLCFMSTLLILFQIILRRNVNMSISNLSASRTEFRDDFSLRRELICLLGHESLQPSDFCLCRR